jgi:hypothetical protein
LSIDSWDNIMGTFVSARHLLVVSVAKQGGFMSGAGPNWVVVSAKDCGEYRQAAGVAAKDLKLVVNPQANQVKDKETGNKRCHNKKRPHQPLSKGLLSRQATVRERSFVDRRAVTILDPRCVSLAPLVREISKRPIRVVGCIFDYPSRHGVMAHLFALAVPILKHGWNI